MLFFFKISVVFPAQRCSFHVIFANNKNPMNILKDRFEIDYFGNKVEISRYFYEIPIISLYRFDMKNGMICNLYEYGGGWRFEDKEHTETAQEIGELIEQHYRETNGRLSSRFNK
ncbi:MAG: hypothetical protein JWP81_2349 [Ferruginibacter sp.]|nr:hypothetical protein [Ferruginibacter sp.]